MTDWRSEPLPPRIAKLQKNKDGYPVPWFVGVVDGVPDFRLMDEDKLIDAIKFKLCWVCGEKLGSNMAFVIGPMCAINRNSAEPPSHLDCAIFSARACPFLSNPERPRRESNLPKERRDPAGITIARNPGVTMIYVTSSYKLNRVSNGILFTIGECTGVLWFARGRKATRAEVMESIESGLPLLKEHAEKEAGAMDELNRRYDEAMKLLPAV